MKMRKLHKSFDDGKDSDIKNEAHPTKIPGLRVRQVVEQLKVKDEPSDKNTRRSSIPKLVSKSRSRTPSVDKGTYRISRRHERSSIDETFEKIYIEAAVEIDKVDDKLNEIVTDLDDVDNQFEIVANAYENIELPVIEKKQSKIPIKRFISQQVTKNKLQNIERRHSVHTNIASNNYKRLTKKKINSIDTLDDLLDEVNNKTSKGSTLTTKINNAQNKTLTNLQHSEDLYDDVIVTLLPKIETSQPSLIYEDQNEPHYSSIEQTKAIIEQIPSNLQRKSIELEIVSDDPSIDIKELRESYNVELKNDIPLTNSDEPNKPYHRVFITEETLSDYDNVEIRPVSSKIAIFEQRSNSSTKSNSSPSIEVEKSLEFLEVKVSKSEDKPNIVPIVNIDEPAEAKENKTIKTMEPVKILKLADQPYINPVVKIDEPAKTKENKTRKTIEPIIVSKSEEQPHIDPIVKIDEPARPKENKPIKKIEAAMVSKSEEQLYIDILKIDEPTKTKENKKLKTQPTIENASDSIIEARNKVMEHFRIEARNKSIEVVDTTKIKPKSEGPIKMSKSTTDIDSGGALSYQKQRKYNRLSSVEKLVNKIERNNKICPIDFKEMPRRKSVSEKIALFEGKLAQPLNDQISNTVVESIKYKLLNYASNAETNETNSEIVRNDPYAVKIEELKSAKLRYGSMKDVKCIELNNGIKMPVIALGTALLDPELTFHVISAAIDLGYRAFDTAYIDGNERDIGAAIKYKIEDGTVRREELFIINKLWSTFHRTDLVERACMNSLEIMQLDYFDLYLIHNPMSFKEGPNPIPKIASVLQYSSSDYLDAWFGMEDLVQKGLVRSIGVSNFNSVQLARIVEKGKIPPVVNQVESHPYLSQVRLQEFCSVYNVVIQSYGVLGSTNGVLADSLVRICAAAMKAEPAQTLIRFQLDMERAVVVKASSGQHLWSNLQSTDIIVNPAELRTLHALNTNRRLFNYKGLGDTHRNYPFNLPF